MDAGFAVGLKTKTLPLRFCDGFTTAACGRVWRRVEYWGGFAGSPPSCIDMRLAYCARGIPGLDFFGRFNFWPDDCTRIAHSGDQAAVIPRNL